MYEHLLNISSHMLDYFVPRHPAMHVCYFLVMST